MFSLRIIRILLPHNKLSIIPHHPCIIYIRGLDTAIIYLSSFIIQIRAIVEIFLRKIPCVRILLSLSYWGLQFRIRKRDTFIHIVHQQINLISLCLVSQMIIVWRNGELRMFDCMTSYWISCKVIIKIRRHREDKVFWGFRFLDKRLSRRIVMIELSHLDWDVIICLAMRFCLMSMFSLIDDMRGRSCDCLFWLWLYSLYVFIQILGRSFSLNIRDLLLIPSYLPWLRLLNLHLLSLPLSCLLYFILYLWHSFFFLLMSVISFPDLYWFFYLLI